MRLTRFSARLAALATAVAVIASCETRSITDPTIPDPGNNLPPVGADNVAPTVKVSLATGTTSADTIVYLGGNLGVVITSTDNLGVSILQTTLRTASGSSIVDSVTMYPTLTSVTRPYTIDAATVARGAKLVFTTKAMDASANTKFDSLRVTVADTATPVVTVTSKAPGTVKGLDSIDVNVTATDAAGIDSAGFRLVRVRAPGDTVLVFTRSAKPGARVTSFTIPDYGFRISDTLPVGQYLLVPFAADRSGLAARNITPFSFQLTDATRPVITLINPTAAGHVAVGDSLYVVARLTDNAGVSGVTFTGLSARGNPALGTQDTVIRYGTVAAPTSGSFPATRDTTITRWLKVVAPVDTLTDSLIVRARVTDASGNATQLDLKVHLVPTLSVTSTALGTTLRNRDTVRVRVTAGDTIGVTYYGYSLTRVGDLAPARRDSVLLPAGTRVDARVFTYVLPDGFLPGTYAISAFSAVQSPVASRTATSSTFSLTDGVPPTLQITTPINGGTQAVGDSMLVVVDLADSVGVAKVDLRGYSVRGDSTLGTQVKLDRYTALSAPASGNFPAGTKTITVQRYMQVITSPKVDSTADSLTIQATVTDVSGLTSTKSIRVAMTNGPKLTLLQPVYGDSITKGTAFTITMTAMSNIGVRSLGFTLGDSGFVTPITPAVNDSLLLAASGPYQVVTYSKTVQIPASASGYLTITPHAADINGQKSVGAVFKIGVRSGNAPPPVVHHVLAPRVEIVDSVQVTVSGTSLRTVGYSLHETLTGALVDSGAVVASASSFGPKNIGFRIAPQYQGKQVAILTYATDSLGNIGYSSPSYATTPITDPAKARRDTALVVFGRTFALPASRPGVIADVLVDTIHGNVFLTNKQAGRLEVFQQSTSSFDPTGIVVGSQPYGMTMSRTAPLGDTLYVANSGGTNLSRVYIGGTPATMKEDLTNRLVTRMSFLYKVTEVRDPETGRIRISVSAPINFSDRPQFVQQSSGGRLYISTKPTDAAPRGTVRWIDPKAPAPDERFLLAFATGGGDPNSYLIANIDNAGVSPASATSAANDTLTLCDHPSGSTAAATCVRSAAGIGATIAALQAAVPTTDLEAMAGADETSLGLSDTTFIASSGNGAWIGFGEGMVNPARTMLVHDADPTLNKYTYATPSIHIDDLVRNSSDALFGLALDKTGKTLAVHGVETYFALVDEPFTSRLQGKHATYASGAGIAFHPGADGITTPQDQRLAFVASANGTVEMLDIAYYDYNRGTLVTKSNFYGPIRVVNPTPAEQAAGIRVKIYGMSANGLVIIDVTNSDILPAP